MNDNSETTRQPWTFELLDESGVGLADGVGMLDERERRLLVGAANFHSLAAPGRTFRLTVLRGPRGTLPSLTDKMVHRIEWPDDRAVVGSLLIRSIATSPSGTAPATGLADLVIDLGGEPDLADAYAKLPGWKGKARRAVRFMAPVQFDVLRQYRTDVVEKRMRATGIHRKAPVLVERGASLDAPQRGPALLFGMHWLEMGGAERWALDTVALAKEAGFTPIVITDRESSQPWITRPELDGAVVVPLTHDLDVTDEAAFLNGVLATFDVRGVHVHHNTWLYQRLPWLRSVRPDLPMVDSLHILEWRTGGFVDISVRMSNVIDTHHVISPALRDYLIGRQNLPPEKIKLATLANLTTDAVFAPAVREKTAEEKFTVVFVGRFTQQKRPYLFLQLAAKLKKSHGDRVRFIMQGDGELANEVHALRDRLGLADVLEVRGPDRPVSDTLAEADALVVSSDNEGLTLTSFEATSAGVPVISADVGAQASLVADGLLMPRHPYPFLQQSAARIEQMMGSVEARKTWLDEQVSKAAAFAKLPDARSWTRELYEGWMR
ncbi:MAG TPA: glycosyltransferase [Pseudonocardiaceae bacterium]|nr:glycosyltransferase [Pseudonocardiaceae bacterium]